MLDPSVISNIPAQFASIREELINKMNSGELTPEQANAYLEKVAIPQVAQPLHDLASDRDLHKARRDPSVMIEMVFQDKSGRPFKQRSAHRRIQDLLCRSYEAGLKQRALQKPAQEELRNLFIEMPFRSGKTQQFVGFMAWLLGQDQDITGAYIREAIEDAEGVIGQIASIIHLNKAYQAVFPGVKLESRDQRSVPGTKTKFTLVRNQKDLPDPTLVAIGRNKAAEGKRWDIVTLDDAETWKTAFSEAERRRGIGMYDDAWSSRLDPDYGIIIGVGHERHKDGLIAHIKKQPRVETIRVPIMEDMNDYSTCNFPEMYSERFIKEQKQNMTKFLLYYMLQPNDPEEQQRKERAIQRAINRARNEGHIFYDEYQPASGEFVSLGFDLPVKKVRKGGKEADSLTMYAQTFNPETGDHITLGMEMIKAGWYEIIEFIAEKCRKFGLLEPGPRVVVVENVAAQDYVIQAFNDPERGIIKTHPEFRNLRIEPYTTNQQTKLYDIPAVMNGYHNAKEILPDAEITKSYVGGLLSWVPGDHPHDLLMGRVCSDHGIHLLKKAYGVLVDVAQRTLDSTVSGGNGNNKGANWKPDIIDQERARRKAARGAGISSFAVDISGYGGKRW
jgi:hypothetical protein